jgi:hypothetical protein
MLECVRDGALLKVKDTVDHKNGHLEETFGVEHMQLISESFRCC